MTSPLLPPRLICKVRALYLYQSKDSSSLSFEAGDCIEVLAKLDSGWWDGWCDGRRGWFPSNFVETIEDSPAYSHPVDKLLPPPPDMPHSDLKRSSFQSSVSSDVSKDDTSLPDGWTIQLNEDGRPAYYNENTGKTLDYHTFPEHQDEETIIDRKNSSIRHKNRESVASFDSEDEVFFSDFSASALMEKWIERKTPKGRVYFCNTITQETTWNYKDIDPETGRLRKTELSQSELKPISNSQGHFLENDSGELTWNRLAADIALAIHHLSSAAQNKMFDRFPQKTADVVETIRLMFYASNSMEKDTELMQNPIFRDPRRAIMSSLSKLVLSCKLGFESATIQNISNKMLEKIQQDTNDLLVAVRNFVIVCQKHKIKVEYINPKLLKDYNVDILCDTTIHKDSSISNDSSTPSLDAPKRPQSDPNPLGSKHRFQLNQDLVINLQTHAHQIYVSTRELATSAQSVLQGGSEERTRTVNVFQCISNQISKYMQILDDISLKNIDSMPSVSSYKLGRQKLYASIGHLFGSIQSMTSPHTLINDAVKAILIDTEHIDRAIENIEVSVIAMANERRRMIASNSVLKKEDDGDSLNSTQPSFMEAEIIEVKPSSSARIVGAGENDLNEVGGTEEGTKSRSSSTNGRRAPPTSTLFNSIDIKVNRRTQYIGRGDGVNNALTSETDPNDIEFCADNTVKGGTLSALVERLTGHDVLDTNFITTFLLTYRSFCNTEDLISLLEDRYNMLPPERLTPEQLDIWTERKQKLVRLRVFNILKNWLENYYIDEDAYLLSRIEYFTKSCILDVSALAAEQLFNLIRKRSDSSALKVIIPNYVACPEPILPRNMTNLQLNDIDPIEMSRQLSIMDFKLYSSIRTIECLGKAWSRDEEDENLAVNIKHSIKYCNRLTAWVTECILHHEEPRKRAMEIKYWAQVAEQCRAINNFNTCMAVLSAFDNSAIGRLKKTLALCSKNTLQSLAQLRKLMGANRNFTEYRDIIHSVNHPCIPFLGIYLQDLTFIEDGNPDYLKTSENLINFAKRQKAAEIIRELRQFQSFPYHFKPLSEIQGYIKQRLDQSHDVDHLYERSLHLEPRAENIPAK